MAIYEYACSCGNRMELFQGMEDEHVSPCPKCSKLMKRVYSPLKCIFKGNPAWFDVKRAVVDAEYQRKAYFRQKELRGEKV